MKMKWLLIIWLQSSLTIDPQVVVVNHFDSIEACSAVQGQLTLTADQHSACVRDLSP
jgi:hypothetical protein